MLRSIRSFVDTWLRVSLFSMCSASTCIYACCSDRVCRKNFSGLCATVSCLLGSGRYHLVLWVHYAIIHSMQSIIHALQAPWTPTWGSSLLARPLVCPKVQRQAAPRVAMLCVSHSLVSGLQCRGHEFCRGLLSPRIILIDSCTSAEGMTAGAVRISCCLKMAGLPGSHPCA